MTKTKREYFSELKTLVADKPELVAFIDHELELLTKKNSGPKSPTAKQMENERIKDAILAVIESPMTVSDIQTALLPTHDVSNQRITALVTQLVEDNSLVRTVIKRKAFYAKG